MSENQRTKPCDFCGYSPDEAHTLEQMTEEEKLSAIRLFEGPSYEGEPLRTPEECYEMFLWHRMGRYADQFSDENEKTVHYTPKWLSYPKRVLPRFPDDWSGTLWWHGREHGFPDPTLLIKSTPTKPLRVYGWEGGVI